MSYKSKTKYTTISIFILIIGFSITITTFLEVKNASFKELQSSFNREAGVISFIIHNRLMKNLVELKGIDRFYQSSTFVDREEFHTFVTPIIKELTEIKAIAWLPKVSKDERNKFEKILKIEGFNYISEYDENFNLINAKEREFYYPIYYSEPFEKNKKIIGFNVSSQKDKSYAIENSINKNLMYATDKTKFLKDVNFEKDEGIVIFIPIYKQKELNGLLAGAIVLEKLFENAFYKTPINNLSAELYSKNELLYSDKKNIKEIEAPLLLKLFPINLEFNHNINFASKEWSIKVVASNVWIENNIRYDYFVILPIGFILTLITILYINALLEKRFRAESIVDEKINELKESEVRYRQLFDNMKNGVAIYQPFNNGEDFIFKDINLAGEELSKVKKDDIVGKRVTEVFPAIKEMGLLKVFKEVYKSGNMGYLPHTLYKDDRVAQWVENYVYKLPSGEIVAIYEDITKRKIYEYELKKLNETLEVRVKSEVEKNREKDILILQQSRLAMMGEMISAIAHQWRQPLTSIGLIIQKLKLVYKKNMLDEKFIDETTVKVMNHINFMSHTIDDFRSFFKPNRAKEKFYIKESIEAVLTIINEQLKYYGIEIINNIRGDIKIDGFKNEFEQVLLNIINNSKDAFEQKSITGLIILNSFREDENVVITIEDNAGGIKDEIINKIFDPYFTTKHESKGTGIGLYLAKMIIEQNMDGTLSVINVNKGAKFTIKLPFMI